MHHTVIAARHAARAELQVRAPATAGIGATDGHAQRPVRDVKAGRDARDIDFDQGRRYSIVGIDQTFFRVIHNEVPGQAVYPGELPKQADQGLIGIKTSGVKNIAQSGGHVTLVESVCAPLVHSLSNAGAIPAVPSQG